MKLWNKKSVKIVSLALAGTLCVSTVSVLAYSAGANSSSPEADVKEKI